MICEKCGCEHDGSFGSGRFCSRACANSRIRTDEIKKKVSLKLKRYPDRFCLDCGVKLCKIHNKTNYCGKCCPKHTNARPEIRELHRKIQNEKVKNGTHKGWKARNIKSYAEIFWERVLENNKIEYVREKKVGKYFLDFVIGNLDLEIDGKQHQYKERKESDLKRDEFLRNEGYFVYRIRWNEINTEEGKQMMKDKIDLFLSFYDTL